eukprot:m.422659 g.422659  ORF g.422659 m.422659 type:complete len:72 (+) comp21329_c1_seq11:1037-1252(+)
MISNPENQSGVFLDARTEAQCCTSGGRFVWNNTYALEQFRRLGERAQQAPTYVLQHCVVVQPTPCSQRDGA